MEEQGGESTLIQTSHLCATYDNKKTVPKTGDVLWLFEPVPGSVGMEPVAWHVVCAEELHCERGFRKPYLVELARRDET